MTATRDRRHGDPLLGGVHRLGSRRRPWAATGTLAHEVDGFILGGFTTEATLQTFISGVNVLGGAFVGRLIHDVSDRERLVKLLVARAAGLIGLGLLLSLVVPLNKRLWSPPFTVLTVGTSLAWLAIGIWLIDLRGARRATAPLVHLGANPIAIYVGFFTSLSVLRNHGGSLVPDIAPGGSVVAGAFLYAGAWTALWWIAPTPCTAVGSSSRSRHPTGLIPLVTPRDFTRSSTLRVDTPRT